MPTSLVVHQRQLYLVFSVFFFISTHTVYCKLFVTKWTLRAFLKAL